MAQQNEPHYDGDNCMRFIEKLGGGPDFCATVAIKYAWRIGRKAGETVERDVRNIRWYLDRFEKTATPKALRKYGPVLEIVRSIADGAERGLPEGFHAPPLLLAVLDPEPKE